MITIQSAMLVALGFCVAALFGFLLAPFYRRRTERLATDALRATVPLTSAEIAADKDRLRAQYALTIHALEKKLDDATHQAAKQMVEINRRDAGISALEGDVHRLSTALEEHENARRVLEQTITERLPKVELRLAEAKKLLFQRDREIASLTQASAKQTQALEEAAQINAQQRDELHRLNATLAARAARNRESVADPRFDGEVALRAELEALRTKAREQAAMISRLQGLFSVNNRSERGAASGQSTASFADLSPADAREAGPAPGGLADHEAEIQRLRKDLADAEIALKSARGMAEQGSASQATLEAESRALRAANEDLSAEVAKLKAALKAYQEEDTDERALKDSKIAMRARLSALQAQSDEQSTTIQRLRAEVAAANEKLARQAAHFMGEMRRLGIGTRPPSAPAPRDVPEKAARQPLVERISAPRPPRQSTAATAGAGEDPARVSGFLRALGGSASAPAAETGALEEQTDAAADSGSPERRASLMERITRAEKPVA